MRGMKDRKWTKLGETEVKTNNLSPCFDKTFMVNYKFERDQILKCEVFDQDDKGKELIGNYECALNNVLTSNNQTIVGELSMGEVNSKRGRIYVTANSVSASNHVARMKVSCHVLDKKAKEKKGFLCFCKSPEDNPFLVIERQSTIKEDRGKDNWILVLETEEIEGELDPKFHKISINIFHLC